MPRTGYLCDSSQGSQVTTPSGYSFPEGLPTKVCPQGVYDCLHLSSLAFVSPPPPGEFALASALRKRELETVRI